VVFFFFLVVCFLFCFALRLFLVLSLGSIQNCETFPSVRGTSTDLKLNKQFDVIHLSTKEILNKV
jgi:hypothetical protein